MHLAAMNVAASVDGLGTVAGIITALTGLVVSVGGLLTVVKVLVPNYRVNKETKQIAVDTHVLVNQAYTDLQQYNKMLKRALTVAGVDIPEDQSKLD